jgi:hypothetical protein
VAKIDNSRCDIALSGDRREGIQVFDEVLFCKQAVSKLFSLSRGSIYVLSSLMY